jgi:hypothetical protein
LLPKFASTVSTHVFTAEPFDSGLGKGYGEAQMLEQIAHAGIGSKYMLKCTGRLSVANIGSLLTTLDSAPDIVIRLTKDFAYADSRLFVVSSALLSDLTSNLASEANDSRGLYLEHALARRVLRLAGRRSPRPFLGRIASVRGTERLDWPTVRLRRIVASVAC